MKTRELRQKSTGELEKILQEKKGKIFDARFGLQSGQNKKVHELKDAKKDLARIYTLLAEQAKDETQTK